MTSRIAFAAVSAAALISTAASAAIVTFTGQTVWTNYSTNQGQSIFTENFNSYNGFYASPVVGTTGPVTWTATALGGLYADSGFGFFSTNDAAVALNFSFAPGVKGVAGNFFATFVDFSVAPSIIEVMLADGSSYVGFSNSLSDFVGFYSTGATIASLSIRVDPALLGQGPIFATVDNLYFATVPAPGAIALLGVAGFVSRRRNRA